MTGDRGPLLARPRSTLLIAAVVGLLMCLIGFGLGAWFRAPTETLRASESEPVTAEVPVENRVLAEPVTVTGQYTTGRRSDITVDVADGPAVVTEVAVKKDDSLRSGSAIAKVSGRPVIALYGTFPLYRDLEVGDRGDDARELNDILRGLGFASGGGAEITEATSRGLGQLYAAVGEEAPRAAGSEADDASASPRKEKFRLQDFYFLPSPTVTVVSMSRVGATLDADGGTLGTVRTGTNQITARTEAKDIGAFAEGSTVTGASADGSSGPIGLEVSSISDFQEADETGELPPGYDVRFTPQGEVPKSLTDGATVSITAAPENAEEATAVPLSAVRTQGVKSYVLLGGGSDEKCFVETGAEAAGWVEITADCAAAGDLVVVGP